MSQLSPVTPPNPNRSVCFSDYTGTHITDEEQTIMAQNGATQHLVTPDARTIDNGVSTMLMMMLGIAAGPTVATWDCSSSELNSSFQPHGVDVDVADIAWNHNGQVLASVATNTTQKENGPARCEPVVLTSVHSQKPLESFRQAWNGKLALSSSSSFCGYTSITFGIKSRYLCLGDTLGDVHLLDLKKYGIVRQFASTDGLACRQACLDPTESFVLVLTKETLSLFQLREGTLLCKFSVYDDTSGALSFTTFHVSPFRQLPLVVAVGTDQGCVQVLETAPDTSHDNASYDDEQTWQPRFTLPAAAAAASSASYRPHTVIAAASPIVGLSFSAHLKPLLVSVSRHGHVAFDDVDLGKRIEQRRVAERVVTTLAYHGDVLALGTDDGHIAIYDIRNLHEPLSTFQMGDAITCLRFSPAVATSAAAGAAAAVIQEHPAAKNRTTAISGQRLGNNDTPTRSNVSPAKHVIPPLPPPLVDPSSSSTTTVVDTEQRDPTEPRCESSQGQQHHQQHPQQSPQLTTVDMEGVKALIQQEVRDNLLPTETIARNGAHHGPPPSSSSLAPEDLAVVRSMIQEEMVMIRDELQQHIQNLHIDMLKEFVRLEEKLEGNQNHRR